MSEIERMKVKKHACIVLRWLKEDGGVEEYKTVGKFTWDCSDVYMKSDDLR